MMKMRWAIFVILGFFAHRAPGQEAGPAPILSDRPDASADADLLGETFESASGGIALRVPAGMTLLRRGAGAELAQFGDEKRNWVFRITRKTLSAPLPLLSAPADEGQKPAENIVGNVLRDLMTEHPRAQIVRDDAMMLGENDVALLAARITLGTQRHLMQQAIIAANPRVYYVISLSSPTSVAADADESASDPREQSAVQAFMQSLQSVRLEDLAAIRQEQDRRLLNTRDFYDSLTPQKLQDVLVGEQWLRIVRNGKEIGYSYVIEESETITPTRQSITVAMRTRSADDKQPGVRHDAETWMHLSDDRRHESWSTVQVLSRDGQAVDHGSELGSSDYVIRRVLDRRQEIDGDDPKQPPIRQEEQYVLKVTHVAKSVTAPRVERDLPPFYLPRALGHLLPRLLPLDQSREYLMAGYAGDAREVMLRYVDVGAETDVTLDGKSLRAVPVSERVGSEGPVTTHYLSGDGKYLGSVNESAGITILPSDEETLLKIWKDADLTRPQAPLEQEMMPSDGKDR